MRSRQAGRSLTRAALAGFAVMIFAAPAMAQTRFETRLSPVAEDILTRDNLAGSGRARATLDGDQLTVAGEYQGLPSTAIGAELRQGFAIGAPSAKVVGPLQVSGDRQGTLSGVVRLDAAQLAALKAGWMYVQIKSEKAPDGNLWGWLLPPRAPAAR